MLLDRVVIGSSSTAAYYALMNDCYFVPTRNRPELFYREDTKIWTKLNLSLGLLSKLICYDDAETIRLVDGELRISAANTTYKYEFGCCHVFDPTGVQLENDISSLRPKTFLVLDDFELSTLGPHQFEIQPISTQRAFAREVHFYCSDRVDGASYITDCIVESELTQEQINSFEYSDTMARFIVERHLTSVGVCGIFMEYYKSGKPKFRKPKVKHVRRIVVERDNNLYADTERVKIVNSSLEDLVEEVAKR